MDLRKTRLWHGDLQHLIERADQQDDVQRAEPSPIARAIAKPISNPLPMSSVDFDRSSTIVGYVASISELKTEAAPAKPDMRTTRIVPIESLLQTAPVVEEEEPVSLPGPSLSRHAAFLRRGAIVVLVIGIGALQLTSRQPHGVVASAPATAAPIQAAVVPPPEPVHDSAPSTLEPRVALDALASGDYAAAHDRYAELARNTPGRTAYSEAARILGERLQATR